MGVVSNCSITMRVQCSTELHSINHVHNGLKYLIPPMQQSGDYNLNPNTLSSLVIDIVQDTGNKVLGSVGTSQIVVQ